MADERVVVPAIPRSEVSEGLRNDLRRGELPRRRFIVEQRETQLLHVVGAGTAAGRFARRLDGRQQKTDERADDGDHHEQFHERKAGTVAADMAVEQDRRHDVWPFVGGRGS